MDLVIERELACEPGNRIRSLAIGRGSGVVVVAAHHRRQLPHHPRVGGGYEIVSTAAGIGVRGEFLSLDAGTEIGMTWNWMNDGVSEVSEKVWVRFTPIDGGTMVSVTHELDDTAGDGEDIRQGWAGCPGQIGRRGVTHGIIWQRPPAPTPCDFG